MRTSIFLIAIVFCFISNAYSQSKKDLLDSINGLKKTINIELQALAANDKLINKRLDSCNSELKVQKELYYSLLNYTKDLKNKLVLLQDSLDKLKINSKVLLDFSIGMSKTDYENHYKNIILEMDSEGHGAYKLNSDNVVSFVPCFDNNLLKYFIVYPCYLFGSTGGTGQIIYHEWRLAIENSTVENLFFYYREKFGNPVAKKEFTNRKIFLFRDADVNIYFDFGDIDKYMYNENNYAKIIYSKYELNLDDIKEFKCKSN